MSATARRPDEAVSPHDDRARVLDPSEIADFVRARREANGWSQETLAALAGFNVRTLQRVEEGKPSSLDTRRALARAFQFDDIDFFTKPMPEPDEAQITRLVHECQQLQAERDALDARMSRLNSQMELTQMTLNMAAARDARWLQMVRTTLMPRQPGRIPFHHSVEVSLRGFKVSMRGKPTVLAVTWSKVPRQEGALTRGYDAALIITGGDFAPGVTIAQRFRGAPGNGAPDLSNHWKQPNIYFGDYLEISTGIDGDESAASWMGMEFAVRNPEGQMSEWVPFSHDLDDGKMRERLIAMRSEGERLLVAGQAAAAVDPLRRAWILSRALFGWASPEYEEHETTWNRAIDQARLDTLNFRPGARLAIFRGPNKGKEGLVTRLALRHHHAYVIDVGGEEVQASADEVELVCDERN